MSVAAVSEPRDSPFGRIASRAMSSGGLLSVSQDFTAERPSAYKVAGSSKNAVRRAQTENVFCIQNICISQIATEAGQYLRGIGLPHGASAHPAATLLASLSERLPGFRPFDALAAMSQ
jgi:hypothetical protein